MPADTWMALAVVAAAVGYLAWRAVRKARARKAGGPNCDRCAH